MTSASERASGVMRIASRRLADRYPFHAHLLSVAQVTEENAITTMAVTIRGGRLALLYCPDFVVACDLEQIVGVLHHEVLHVVFGHLLEKPERFPDRAARVIAEEVTVNEWIPERLPGKPVLLKDYPRLPPGEDTDTRYRRLEGKLAGRRSPTTADDHEAWEEARAAGRVAESVVLSAVQRAADMLTPGERARVPVELQNAIELACRGKAAGRDVERLPESGGDARVPWQTILRAFVGRNTSRHPSYLRPPRRFPHLVGVVPGHARLLDVPRVVAVIDTSGSVTVDLLEQIAAELQKIAARHDVVIVECDAEIQRVYPFAGELREVHGRGGTDLKPPFDRGLLERLRGDVLVYFTDGLGPAPAAPPTIPVLWCLAPGGERPATWGRAVWMV